MSFLEYHIPSSFATSHPQLLDGVKAVAANVAPVLIVSQGSSLAATGRLKYNSIGTTRATFDRDRDREHAQKLGEGSFSIATC